MALMMESLFNLENATGGEKSQTFGSGPCGETVPKALLVNLVY